MKLAAPLVGGDRRRHSATGVIVLVAEFGSKSATFGVWPTNGSSSSRNNILCNRFFHEVIEIIKGAAARHQLKRHAGLE